MDCIITTLFNQESRNMIAYILNIEDILCNMVQQLGTPRNDVNNSSIFL